MKPRVTVSLSPQLPHWQLAIYGSSPAVAARSFALVSTLLVGVFVIAILSGGSLLMWQARRNMLEAQQRTSFVANVSHELKTPLTTIRMYSEMMAEGRVTAEEKRRSYLETITRETQRLTRLINNVLDFSRLEQGKKKYQTERLDIAAVTREVLDSQADRLREAGLVLTTELPDEPCFAKLDRDALAQCLLNLVDNAIKYAATGCKLTVQLRKSDANWRLVVEDAGTGVPTAHRAKLFEQFHRADDSLTAKVAGFGLGLSISRRLLRDQGGELLYEHVESGGARFIMVLPGDAT
jgi:signal transduction histidine kinase